MELLSVFFAPGVVQQQQLSSCQTYKYEHLSTWKHMTHNDIEYSQRYLTVLFTSLVCCCCVKSNTHLYSHTTRANRSFRIWVAALWGQQPVISSKREEDEHSCQSPKEAGEKQCHTQLHGPGLTGCSATGCPHSVWLSPPTTVSACDKLRQKQSLLLLCIRSTEWDQLLLCTAALCWLNESWLLSCLVLSCPLSLCYGRTRLCTWLPWTIHWGLQPAPTAHPHPPQLPRVIFGVWLKAAASLRCGMSVWSSCRVWREGGRGSSQK